MSITHISTTQNNHGNSNGNWTFNVPSVTAQAGDIIVIQTIARTTTTVMSTAAWNGQASTNIGSASNAQTGMSMRYIVAASSGTFNVTGDMSDGTFVTATASVFRPSGTVTVAGLTTAFHDSGTYTNPSLNIASVPADSICVSFLAMLGWSQSFADTTGTTMSAGGSFTERGNAQNTGFPAVTRSYVSTREASGSVTASWTASAGQPMWVHAMFYLQNTSAASVTIDSTPANIRVAESRTVRATTTATPITTLNTVIKINDVANAAIVPTSCTLVTGLTYDIAFTVPDAYSGLKYDSTGYTINVITTDGADSSVNVPYLPVTGNDFVNPTVAVPGDLVVLSGTLGTDDQIEYGTAGGTISIDTSCVITYTGTNPAGVSFSVRVWDNLDDTWGSYASMDFGGKNENALAKYGIVERGLAKYGLIY